MADSQSQLRPWLGLGRGRQHVCRLELVRGLLPSEPAEEYEGGYSGGLIRNQNRPAVGSVECWDADLYKSVTPIPDLDANLTFGIDYIEPGSITTMN